MRSSWSVSAVVLLMSLTTVTAFFVLKFGSKCPRPPVKQDFDVTRYMDKWWEYQRFPAPFEFASTCGFANYTLISSNQVKVVNSGIQKIKFFGWVVYRKPILAIGQAGIVDPSRPGELRVSFPGSPTINDKGPNYFVVDTDYDNYAVVFSCSDFVIGNVQFAWILTRRQGEKPSNLAQIYKTLKDSGVDVRPFLTVEQRDCHL